MTKQYASIVISDTHTPNALPILKGSIGPDAIDVRALLGQQNLLTYDPGFRSTASATVRSPISTAMPVSCSIAAMRLKSWRHIAIFRRLRIC